MKNAANKYKFYKMLLEMDLTSQQRERLMLSEADGIFSKLKGAISKFLGGDAAKELPQEIVSDEKFPEVVKNMKGPFKDGVKELNAIATKAKVEPKKLIDYVINQILDELNVKPADVAAATTMTGGEEADDDKGGKSGKSAVAPGTVLKPEAEETKQALVQVAASLQNKDPDKVAANVEDVDTASSVLGKIIAGIAKVPVKDSSLVIKTLMDLGRLKKEGRRAHVGHLLLASRRISESVYIQERWMKLAGLPMLNEEQNFSNDAIIQAAKDVGIKSVQDFKDALKQLNKPNGKQTPLGKKLGVTDKLKNLTGNKNLLTAFESAVASSGQAGAKGGDAAKGASAGGKAAESTDAYADVKKKTIEKYQEFRKKLQAFNANADTQKAAAATSDLIKTFNSFLSDVKGNIDFRDVKDEMSKDGTDLGTSMAWHSSRDDGQQYENEIEKFLEEWKEVTGDNTANTGYFQSVAKNKLALAAKYKQQSAAAGADSAKAEEDIKKAKEAQAQAKEAQAQAGGAKGGAPAASDGGGEAKDAAPAAAAAEAVPKEAKEAVKKAKQNYGSSLSAVNKRLKDQVSLENIAKVLIALDETGEVEVVG